jgi:hypothetical protein
MILPPQAKLAIGAVALLGAFSAGWKIESLRWHAHEAKALKQTQAAFQQQLAKQNKEATSYEQERETARVEYVTREGQIRTIYKDRPVSAECEPPAGVRDVLSSAIGSANAGTAQLGSEVQQPTGAAGGPDRP